MSKTHKAASLAALTGFISMGALVALIFIAAATAG
jgi:hypothetical protein